MGNTHSDLVEFLNIVPSTGRAWQTFDDVRLPSGRPRRDRRLANVIFGDFDQVQQRLRRLNDPGVGAGVFVTANLTDELGRKGANITRLVAIVADIDHGRLKAFPIESTLLVETSPGRFQAWWVLIPGEELSVGEHRAIMQSLVAEYGADPNAVDVARVYRPPGFWHLKGEPFFVRIVGGSLQLVRHRDLVAAFPPPVQRPHE